MPFYTVLSPLKHSKKRYEPGAVVELPDDLGASLTADGVVKPGGTPPPDEPTVIEVASPKGDSEGADSSQSPSLLNINTADAEAIADGINGIGLTTARAIVKLRESKPEKRFTSLDELKTISRVDWDAVFPLITLE